MRKKNFFSDQVWQVAQNAQRSKYENERRFLDAIIDGDQKTIQAMHAAHQAPGVLFTPKEQVKYLVGLAAKAGANVDMFKQLFEIYPKTLNERLLLEREQYIGLYYDGEGRIKYGEKEFLGMGCTRYEGDDDSNYPEYEYIDYSCTQNESCFNIALETSIDCARALINALKAVPGFQYSDMLTKKENILDTATNTNSLYGI